jgi:hypothetical protein
MIALDGPAARTLLVIAAGLVLLILFLDALVNIALGGLSSASCFFSLQQPSAG